MYSTWVCAVNYSGDGKPLVFAVAEGDVVKIHGIPVPVYYCPSRLAPAAYPGVVHLPSGNVNAPVAKFDYALNEGSLTPRPPPTDDVRNYVGGRGGIAQNFEWDEFPRNVVRRKDVTDGLGKTYLVGDKGTPTGSYESMPAPGVDGTSIFGCTDNFTDDTYPFGHTSHVLPAHDYNAPGWGSVALNFLGNQGGPNFGSASVNLERRVLRRFGASPLVQYQLSHALRPFHPCRR